MKKALLTFCTMLLIGSVSLFSQTGTIKGFVYDASSGQPMPMATISLTGTQNVVSSNQDGFFVVFNVPSGSQTIRISFIGFGAATQTITVRAKGTEQVNVWLKPEIRKLQEATISADRWRAEHLNTVSAHHIDQVTLKRVPGITGQSDLAEYLQVIPGVIFTGDRGGQFYVRGGEPVQNLVKIDGMTVISPFHSIGFASVFDTETISSVDVSTAGFGASHGGRISSVIDVKTRAGNRKEFKAKIAPSTFGYGLIVEGPIKKMTEDSPSSISFLLSNKGSYISETAGFLYPHLDSDGIPYHYNDIFGKVSFVDRRGNQMDVFGMHNTDATDISGLLRSTWVSNGGGFRFLATPSGSNLLFESTLNYSDYQGEYLEQYMRVRSTRYNSIEGAFRVHWNWPAVKLIWGTEMNWVHTDHVFARPGNYYTDYEYFTTELVTYLDSRFETKRLLIEPGFRLHYYADQSFFSPEPRLKLRYRINKVLNINMATGLYAQSLASSTSTEDVVNLFQGFYSGPGWVRDYFQGKYVDDKISLAWHGVLGLSYFGPKNLKLSLEGYVKDYYRMINYNRYKTDSETNIFLIERGWAYGADFMAEWNAESWNLYLAYSLGYVIREDDYGQYIPHFDRRHNLNLVGGFKPGNRNDWEFKARWNLGSGFPFTQSLGLYEGLTTGYDNFYLDPTTSGVGGIWYGEMNKGRLPWYHRLDISVQKTWHFANDQELNLSLGVMNVYNRLNVFYVNRISMQRTNQLPVLPTLGLSWNF